MYLLKLHMYYTTQLLSDSISKTRNVFLNEVLEMEGNPDGITGMIALHRLML